MSTNRMNRYMEKMEYIIDSLENIPQNPERPIEISGTFYNLLTSIEAAMDISAMLVKDLGSTVEDDYANLDKLQELGVIDSELAEKLKKCNGLRNWLVHRYNRVDNKLVLESVDDVKDALITFLERVKDVLKKIEV